MNKAFKNMTDEELMDSQYKSELAINWHKKRLLKMNAEMKKRNIKPVTSIHLENCKKEYEQLETKLG
jgi:hypothetical protein